MAAQTGREMTVEAWAAELGCVPETLRKAIRRHELLARRLPLKRGRPYLIHARDMQAFLDKRRAQ